MTAGARSAARRRVAEAAPPVHLRPSRGPGALASRNGRSDALRVLYDRKRGADETMSRGREREEDRGEIE